MYALKVSEGRYSLPIQVRLNDILLSAEEISLIFRVFVQALCVNEFKGEVFDCGSVEESQCQRTGTATASIHSIVTFIRPWGTTA